jgi:hypothetical protein
VRQTVRYPFAIQPRKGETFQVKDGRGRVVERWTCVEQTRDPQVGVFDIQGFVDMAGPSA